MKNRLFSTVLSIVWLVTAGLVQADLIQHLDATVSGSVTGDPVTQWADQSSYGNDATDDVGNVYYPSTSLSASGLAGLDLGTSRNTLELFNASGQDSWLNQSSGSGFCVLIAFKCDALTGSWNDLIGNSSSATTEGFGMRWSSSGSMQAYLGGNSFNKGGSSVAAGDTIVYAFNYNGSTDSYEFWDSKNNNSITGSVTATDFSLSTAATLGSTTNSGRYFNGMVGEVKIYDAALSAAQFQSERDALVAKWVVGSGGGDTDPPTPNAATFATALVAVNSSVITMTATTGSDSTLPIQYYFTETSDNPGGNDSGWQTDPSYSDSGLSSETEYTYTVTMRDAVTPTPNVGSASAPASATTPVGDIDPPTPNAATFATMPVALGSTVITMTATTGSDSTLPIQYYFAETSGNPGGNDSGWQTDPSYSDGGLSSETEYTYTVTMRDAATPTPNVGSTSAPASATTGIATISETPNIVFMFADDSGYADFGCYGHPYARTPAIDSLATEGTRFESFHVTGITCCPSRTGFMTSRHPASYPGYPADQGFADKVTVTELMHKGGYRVGHFGKWHIGPTPIEKIGTYGIDELDTPSGNSDALDGRDGTLYNNAIAFIDRHNQNHPGVPFYVNIWGHSTHYAVNPPAEYIAEFADLVVDRDDFYTHAENPDNNIMGIQEQFDNSLGYDPDLDTSMQNYMGDIWAIDLNVARVLDKLDELGLTNDTIVVFSSDQGPAPATGDGEYKKNMLGYAGVYRGGKHNQYEGGVRSPFIIRWPGHVPAGVVNSTSTFSGLDWLPTMCSIAGIDIGSLQVEGQDVSDILLGATRSPDRPLFWKTSSVNSAPAMLEGKWKLHDTKNVLELYDLETDPSESINLATTRSDIVDVMLPKLDAWRATLPTSYDKTDPPVTPLSPSASAGADQQIYDLDSDGAEPVTLDASASSDPDGYISGYIWRESGQIIGLTDGPTVSLALGAHTIEVEVTDYAGNTDFDTVTITISTSPGLGIDDLRQLCTYWLNDCSAPNWCQSMDTNHDKKVNLQDFADLTNLWTP